ncbi:hypothetical protein PGT21_023215 [Puccinia graminis f. sp. tritici]|uniref:Uncharacterized protein n=1 Tax=Puccinia graminis f. sp. tritici TaxID=56615 RepID=A0A5B0MY79_PUCGR|nr:hypothetical protein PGT21_023215 [Puccinia graminis f. sp. tritici]KAA1116731.1 hypothetical protein PGTUg99_005619 [Puccinia graminis f. sp. tritici]
MDWSPRTPVWSSLSHLSIRFRFSTLPSLAVGTPVAMAYATMITTILASEYIPSLIVFIRHRRCHSPLDHAPKFTEEYVTKAATFFIDCLTKRDPKIMLVVVVIVHAAILALLVYMIVPRAKSESTKSDPALKALAECQEHRSLSLEQQIASSKHQSAQFAILERQIAALQHQLTVLECRVITGQSSTH